MKAHPLTVVPTDPEALKLLAARAERLRQQGRESETSALVEVAELVAGDARYVIPLDCLQGAMPLKLVCPVPLAPAHILGVLRFGGQVVPAFSFASLVSSAGWRQDPAVLLVIDVSPEHEDAPEWVAFDAEEIPRVKAVPRAVLDRARANAGSAALCPVVHEGARFTLVDPRKLLASAEVARGS